MRMHLKDRRTGLTNLGRRWRKIDSSISSRRQRPRRRSQGCRRSRTNFTSKYFKANINRPKRGIKSRNLRWKFQSWRAQSKPKSLTKKAPPSFKTRKTQTPIPPAVWRSHAGSSQPILYRSKEWRSSQRVCKNPWKTSLSTPNLKTAVSVSVWPSWTRRCTISSSSNLICLKIELRHNLRVLVQPLVQRICKISCRRSSIKLTTMIYSNMVQGWSINSKIRLKTWNMFAKKSTKSTRICWPIAPTNQQKVSKHQKTLFQEKLLSKVCLTSTASWTITTSSFKIPSINRRISLPQKLLPTAIKNSIWMPTLMDQTMS